jgi:hypothetical protein
MYLPEYAAFSETEYGGVILDKRKGQYWTLNETGAHAVKAVLAGTDLPNIVASICDEYEARFDVVELDVVRLIESLQENRLLRGS